MNASDLQRYKQLLLAKLDELSAVWIKAAAPATGMGVPRGDVVDQAAAQAEADLQIRLHEADARLLRAIEEALTRINRDTFGVCEVCKQPISRARLEAVPWTRVCRNCKEQEHA